jgi:hypothetical protein
MHMPSHPLRRLALGVLLTLALAGLGGCGSDSEKSVQAPDPLARERGQDWAASVNATDWLATVRAEEAARTWAERVGASALAGAEAAAARAAAAPPARVAKAPAPAEKGKTMAKASAKQGKTVAKTHGKQAAPAKGSGAEAVRTQFDTFARAWVGRISRNLRHTAADMALQRDGGGAVVASFMEVDHDSLEMQVKPSASGGASCPFVGVLRYQEHHYESRASSEDEARRGPFTRVKTQRVTEIFRYVSGRWTN